MGFGSAIIALADKLVEFSYAGSPGRLRTIPFDSASFLWKFQQLSKCSFAVDTYRGCKRDIGGHELRA